MEDGTLEITGYEGTDTELEIPGEIGGKQVTRIGWKAFRDCDEFTGVSIPEGVEKIFSDAFRGCSKLIEITIPESVRYIGEDAFEGTKWLENERKKNPCVVVNYILIDGKMYWGCKYPVWGE